MKLSVVMPAQNIYSVGGGRFSSCSIGNPGVNGPGQSQASVLGSQ